MLARITDVSGVNFERNDVGGTDIWISCLIVDGMTIRLEQQKIKKLQKYVRIIPKLSKNNSQTYVQLN